MPVANQWVPLGSTKLKCIWILWSLLETSNEAGRSLAKTRKATFSSFERWATNSLAARADASSQWRLLGRASDEQPVSRIKESVNTMAGKCIVLGRTDVRRG